MHKTSSNSAAPPVAAMVFGVSLLRNCCLLAGCKTGRLRPTYVKNAGGSTELNLSVHAGYSVSALLKPMQRAAQK